MITDLYIDKFKFKVRIVFYQTSVKLKRQVHSKIVFLLNCTPDIPFHISFKDLSLPRGNIL